MTSAFDALNAAAVQLEESTGEAPEPGTTPDAGEQIAALQARIDALREQQAEQDSKKPFMLHMAPGSGKLAYRVTADDITCATESEISPISLIAANLGLSNAYHQLYQPNMATIEEAARKAGFAGGSDQGSILVPGTWLEVPARLAATRPEYS